MLRDVAQMEIYANIDIVLCQFDELPEEKNMLSLVLLYVLFIAFGVVGVGDLFGVNAGRRSKKNDQILLVIRS